MQTTPTTTIPSPLSHALRRKLIKIRRRWGRKLINVCQWRIIHRHIHRTHRRSRRIHWHRTRRPTHAPIMRIVRTALHVRRSRSLLRHRVSSLACLVAVCRLGIRIVELWRLLLGIRVVVLFLRRHLLWRRHLLYLGNADRFLFVAVVLDW
jgi:hypothetical protein